MIYKDKRGRYYMAKFRWKGRLIRKSTRATDADTARSVEAKLRAEVAMGNSSPAEAAPKSVLTDFLRKEFLPFISDQFRMRPKTLDYYTYGVKSLLSSEVSSLRLDEITNQQALLYKDEHVQLSASTINCGLRTLRRALSLALERGKLSRVPQLSLAEGERRRERVLSDDELARYLAACAQPWKDAAVLILRTGMRPGEAYTLRWENVLLYCEGTGLVQTMHEKGQAARRVWPLDPAVSRMLLARWQGQGQPGTGWVFPSRSEGGHLVQGSAKNQHRRALELSGVTPFEPYCLRHTALAELGETWDAFKLARIAGHSSATIGQSGYPHEGVIEGAFNQGANGQALVSGGGQCQKTPGKRAAALERVNIDKSET